MGLFTQRPEENDGEWAGLPSEPLPPRSDAEQLAEPAPADAAGVSWLLGSGGFVVPLPPAAGADEGSADQDEGDSRD